MTKDQLLTLRRNLISSMVTIEKALFEESICVKFFIIDQKTGIYTRDSYEASLTKLRNSDINK